MEPCPASVSWHVSVGRLTDPFQVCPRPFRCDSAAEILRGVMSPRHIIYSWGQLGGISEGEQGHTAAFDPRGQCSAARHL